MSGSTPRNGLLAFLTSPLRFLLGVFVWRESVENDSYQAGAQNQH
jgi:EamA domain-containing membrane protein RarD